MFKSWFKTLFELIKRVQDGWKFIVLDLVEGKIMEKECRKEEVDKIEIVCLKVWQNIFKIKKLCGSRYYNEVFKDNFFSLEEN